MMPRHPEPSLQEKAEKAYLDTYYTTPASRMNRAERRTAQGRQLVAEAHAKALQAKIEVLEEEIAYLKGGAA